MDESAGNSTPPMTVSADAASRVGFQIQNPKSQIQNHAPTSARILAAVIAGAFLGVLIVASRLTPDAAGHGTHLQMGMAPCGWAMYFGKPCVTCGMTTAFAYAARMDLWSSFRTQPMGMLLSVVSAAGFWAALHVAATGSNVGQICGRLFTPAWLWTGAGLAAVAWGYKWVTW